MKGKWKVKWKAIKMEVAEHKSSFAVYMAVSYTHLTLPTNSRV